jgi:predicted nucleotidyltransferase
VEEESLNSVKVFWLEQDKLIEEIKRAAVKLGKEDENVEEIILFGSLAEKRAVPGSDADILIILKADERSFLDRIDEWRTKFSIDFPIEVFPYTEKELHNPLVKEAIKTGIILFKRSK